MKEKGYYQIQSTHAVLIAVIITLLLFYLPVFGSGITNLGYVDSDQHFFYLEAVRKTILEYRQFPMWDPWHMGGIPLIGNPQVPFSPLYFPVFLFGTVIGSKLSLVLLHFIGFIGTYMLARRLTLDRQGALIASIAWSLNGLHAIQLQGGWLLFSHIHLIPLTVWCLLKGDDDWKWGMPCGILMSLLFLGGSPYPLPILMLPVAVGTLIVSIRRKSPRPLLFLFFTLSFGGMLSAVKLIPVLDWMSQNPRNLENIIEGYSLSALFSGLMDYRLSLEYPTPKIYGGSFLSGTVFYLAPEYGMYTGPIVLTLALLGAFRKFPYRFELLAALGLLVLVIMGDYSIVPVDSFFKFFPVYDSMRVVTRFRWPFVLLISLLAGFGASSISEKSKNPTFAYGLLISAVTLNLFIASFNVLMNVFPIKAERVLTQLNKSGTFYQISKPNRYDASGWTTDNPPVFRSVEQPMFPFILENIGVTYGYEPLDLEVYARGLGSPEYKGEAFILSNGEFVTARFKDWSPAMVSIIWSGDLRGTLYLNQNYVKGWRRCDKSHDLPATSLVGTDIDDSDTNMDFCYTPPYFWAGLSVSLLSLFIAISGTISVLRNPQR